MPILFEIVFLMYDTCRENDNLSSIITHKNFVKVTRNVHSIFLVELYEKSQNVIYQCLMSIYSIQCIKCF